MSVSDIKSFYDWVIGSSEEEQKVMKFVDGRLVRGGGLLWLPLVWIMWIELLTVAIHEYQHFTMDFKLICIIFMIITFVLAFFFSFIEIKRIKVLNKYDKHVGDYLGKQGEDYQEVITKFNSMLNIYESPPRNEESFNKAFNDFQKAAIDFRKTYFPKDED